MRRSCLLIGSVVMAGLSPASLSAGDALSVAVERSMRLYGPTLRAARIALETEDGKRAEVVFPGLVVSPTGMVMVAVSDELMSYPRGYFRTFELIRPGEDGRPEPARLIATNDLFNLLFVEPQPPAASQPFVAFNDAVEVPDAAQPLICIGLLDRSLGYRPTFEIGRVGAAIGSDEFTISGLPTDATGTLLLSADGRVVGVSRPSTLTTPEDFLADIGPSGGGFIVQPRGTRASAVAPAVEFAVRERCDRPEPWIGVAGLQVAPAEVCEAFGLERDIVAIIVGATVDNYPAAKAGIRAKDFIIGFDGSPLRRGATEDETLTLWTRSVRQKRVGDEAVVDIWRDRKRQAFTLQLTESPLSDTKAPRAFNAVLGLAVRDLVFRDRFERRLDPSVRGVVVAHLVQSGPAETAELREGDVVQRIDERSITDVGSFRRIVEEKLAEKPSDLVFSVLRGRSQQVILRVELHAGRGDGP